MAPTGSRGAFDAAAHGRCAALLPAGGWERAKRATVPAGSRQDLTKTSGGVTSFILNL